MKTVSTTPPAAMLSKKFWREGEIHEPVASATSGITIETLRAAAAKPLTALSIFRFDAFTWNLSERMAAEEDDALDGFKGDDLSKAMVFADDDDRLWVSGMNNDTAEVEAISFSLFFYLSSLFGNVSLVYEKKHKIWGVGDMSLTWQFLSFEVWFFR